MNFRANQPFVGSSASRTRGMHAHAVNKHTKSYEHAIRAWSATSGAFRQRAFRPVEHLAKTTKHAIANDKP
ncbi:MAG: hypothetical protein U0793_15195 [Gemmataceae bacterium]